MHGEIPLKITAVQLHERIMEHTRYLGWHDIEALEDPKLPLSAPGMSVSPESRARFTKLLPEGFIGKFLETPGPRRYDTRLMPIDHEMKVKHIRAEQERQQKIERDRDMGRGR
jgi:hypothetical protein